MYPLISVCVCSLQQIQSINIFFDGINYKNLYTVSDGDQYFILISHNRSYLCVFHSICFWSNILCLSTQINIHINPSKSSKNPHPPSHPYSLLRVSPYRAHITDYKNVTFISRYEFHLSAYIYNSLQKRSMLHFPLHLAMNSEQWCFIPLSMKNVTNNFYSKYILVSHNRTMP